MNYYKLLHSSKKTVARWLVDGSILQKYFYKDKDPR